MESNRSALDKIISVTNSLEVSPGETIREQLITLINELINKDFAALVQLLYRIDVSEKKDQNVFGKIAKRLLRNGFS